MKIGGFSLKLLTLVFLLSVCVSAQYNAVQYVKPVVVRPEMVTIEPIVVDPVVSESCYDVCKRDCVANNLKDCGRVCEEKCSDKPIVRPLPPVNVKPVPLTCEENCKLMASKSSDASRLFERCLKERCLIEPEPVCPDTCEDKCVEMYFGCTGTPGCSERVVNCLNNCRGIIPPMNCPDKCRLIEKECLSAGVDAESCGLKVKDCVTRCYPQPVPPQRCEDRCALLKDECRKANVDDSSCALKVEDCVMNCQPKLTCEERCMDVERRCGELTGTLRETCLFDARVCRNDCVKPVPKLNCEDICVQRSRECLEANNNPMMCSADLDYCLKVCPGSAVPQGEVKEADFEKSEGVDSQEPSRSFWGRFKAFFTG